MSAMPTVQAKSRNTHGKSAARRLRSEGSVPAVVYGKGITASSVALAPKDVLAVLATEKGQNTVIEMTVDGAKSLVMIKEFSVHPVKRSLVHVDLVEVKLDRPVDVQIPLFTHGKAVGVTAGGLLRQVFRTLPVRCTPDKIPAKLDVDVTELALGDAISTAEVKVPEGVSILLPSEQTIVAVVAPEKDRTEDAAATPGAAAAGAAAAPAAGKDAKAAAPAKDAKADAKKK